MRGRELDTDWMWLWVLVGTLALVMLLGLGGCQSASRLDAMEAANRTAFNQKLAASTQAIQAGDLQQAKVHLEAARSKAAGYEQNRKVQSLAQLIGGAEALIDGNAATASTQWSQILRATPA